MRLYQRTGPMLVASCAVLLALSGCDRADQRSAGQKLDAAITKSQEVAEQAKADAEKVAEQARTAVTSGAATTQAMGQAAASKAADASVTTKVNAALKADHDLSAEKIEASTQDGVVTLTGPAPSTDARERAERIVRDVKGVTSVKNQLTVKSG